MEAQGIEGGSPLETPEKLTSGPASPRARSSRFPGVRDPHPHAVGTPTFPPSTAAASSPERLADVAPHLAAALGVDEGAVRRVLALVRDALVEEPQLGVTECELAAALRRRL